MSIRRLPSGRWQAEVRIPGADGKRTTETFALRSEAKHWQEETRAALRRGDWRDPKSGAVLFDAWLTRWMAARGVEPETATDDWRTIERHVRPRWRGLPLNVIAGSRLEVQAWVTKMTKDGYGQPTVAKVYGLFAACMRAAVEEDLIGRTPCRDITLPEKRPILVAWWEPHEVDLIISRLDEPHATIAALMVWCGLRWEEAAGLPAHAVNWPRREISVIQVVTSARRIKPYAKEAASHRTVRMEGPVRELLLRGWQAAVEARGPKGLLWVARDGRPLLNRAWGEHWRTRIREGRQRGRCAPVALLPVPYHGPHVLRHTGASWLVQAGVSLEEVGLWLGHAPGSESTKRYAHLCPDRSTAKVADVLATIRETRRTG